MRRYGYVMLMCGLAWAGGCSGAEADSGQRTRRLSSASKARFAEASSEQAFAAAHYALRQWFPNVEARPGDNRIVARAVEYDQKGGTERLRDVVGPRNRMRRSGVIEIRSLGQGAEAQCVVDVEKLDTAEHRAMYRDQNRFEDAPTDTPIDRDAGITSEQQQVWTPMSRDRALEREILDVMRTRLGGAGTQPAFVDH